MIRMQRRQLPGKPAKCTKNKCVYNQNEVCDDSRTNSRNSDALCFKWSVCKIAAMLTNKEVN